MIVALLGSTGIGKSSFLHRFYSSDSSNSPNSSKSPPLPPIEIISVDSVQIYRDLSIGSAKPSKGEQEEIPYHLIDLLGYQESFDVAQFIKKTDRAIDEIQERGRLPLLVVGTPFYLKHFLYGLPNIPPIPPRIIEELEEEYLERGGESLFKELTERDPLRAGEISPNDRQRILRSLAVCRYTGELFSSFKMVPTLRERLRGERAPLLIGLKRDRQELYHRIDQRVRQMFDEGLEEEIQTLRDLGAKWGDPSITAIGYREFFDPQYSTLSREERLSLIQRNTRRYAKRQETFFRKIPNVHWIEADDDARFSSLLSSPGLGGGAISL